MKKKKTTPIRAYPTMITIRRSAATRRYVLRFHGSGGAVYGESVRTRREAALKVLQKILRGWYR